jgi:hypothetical protein
MDPTLLMLSLLFGCIGMGLFMYGKKAGRPVPLLTGVALMVMPYFIPSAAILLLVCCALTAVPWLLRHA